MYIGVIWGDNGKENGNYIDYRGYIGVIGYILGIYWGNGKENGNYYNIIVRLRKFRLQWGKTWVRLEGAS